MSISPLSITEKSMNAITDNIMDTLNDIGDMWSSSTSRVTQEVSSDNDKSFDYVKETDADGNISWVLQKVEYDGDSSSSTEIYANFKIMMCSLGDFLNSINGTALKTITSVNEFLDEIIAVVGRYTQKIEKDFIDYLNNKLELFYYIKYVYCAVDGILNWLDELNDKYGNLKADSLHPILADFCLLLKECPLFKGIGKIPTPKLVQQFNNFTDDATSFTERQLRNASRFEQGLDEDNQEYSDSFSKTINERLKEQQELANDINEMRKLTDEYGEIDTEKINASAENNRSTFIKMYVADGYSQEESETLAQIDVDTETQAIRDMKVSIDENSQKYINAVYEIGELQSTIKLIEQGVSEEDIIKGFPIGNSLTFKGSVDSNGKLVEGQILDENGDICDDKFSIDSKKAIEKLNEEDGGIDLAQLICSVSLGKLIKKIQAVITTIMDFVSKYIAIAVKSLSKLAKYILSIIQGAVDDAMGVITDTDLGGVILTIIDYYKDYLKCNKAFCPSPYTAKLIEMGEKLISLFESNIKIKVDTDGNERASINLSDALSKKLITPIFQKIDNLVNNLETTIITIATSCDDLKERNEVNSDAVSIWNTYFRQSTELGDIMIKANVTSQDFYNKLNGDYSKPDFEEWIKNNKFKFLERFNWLHSSTTFPF